MAGLKGKSGPPGNMNAFKHGLAAIQTRREEGISTEHEESVRQQIRDGLIADKGGDEQISTAQDFSGGYSQRRLLAYGVKQCHRPHHPEQPEGPAKPAWPASNLSERLTAVG
jgi:hypothetical protein